MRKALRWAGIGLGAIVALLLVAALVILAWSETIVRRGYAAVPETLPTPSAAAAAEAPRLARVLGCLSCHGEGLKGKLMFDAPGVARVFAPNLTEVAARASDQQLAAGIRQGIGHDGRGLFVMPSAMYSRLGLVLGTFRPVPALVEEYRTQVPIDLGPDHRSARHLAATACSECHGPALMGGSAGPDEKAPDLRLVAGYDPVQFRALMRTGLPPDGRDLGLMTTVGKNDFSHLTDAEIDALYAYLVARAKRLGG
jgi:cytochrome c553